MVVKKEALPLSEDKMGFTEFVILAAAMQALTALSMDAMLPALPAMGSDLQTINVNDVQLIVLTMMMGLALGHVLYGPLSDSIGRKPPIYLGFAVYTAGTLICLSSQTLDWMLCGRFLQGLGIAGPRIVMNAVVRDRFKGNQMARVLSLVMTVFIMVPVLAPSLGQFLLEFFHWQAIFWMFLLFSTIVCIWFHLRLKETLKQSKPFSIKGIQWGLAEILRSRRSLGYTLATGFLFSPMVAYISSAQQIYADVFGMEAEFPLIFGFLALGFGLASLFNARLVMRFGMRRIALTSALLVTGFSFIFWLGLIGFGSRPELWIYIAFMMLVFLGLGFLFGNLNALAMEPLGHIAGVGASFIGFLSHLVAIPIGMLIGRAFDGTIMPQVSGQAFCFLAMVLSILWAESNPSGYQKA